jgi:hypothetical protein
MPAFDADAFFQFVHEDFAISRLEYRNFTGSAGPPTSWQIVSKNGDININSSTNFSTDAWHWITAHCVTGTGTVDGMQVKIDGTSIVNDFSYNWATGDTYFKRLNTGIFGSLATSEFLYFDNIIVDDATEPTEPTDAAGNPWYFYAQQ